MLMITELIRVARGTSVRDQLAVALDQQHGDTLTVGHQRADLGRAPGLEGGGVVTLDLGCSCNLGALHGLKTSYGDATSMTTEQRLALVDQLAAADVEALILAGEPMRSRDLFSIMRHAAAQGLRPRLLTRGEAFDRHTAEALADAGVPYVGVQLEWDPCIEGAHPGECRELRRALRVIEWSRGAGLDVGIHIRLTSDNVEHLPRLVGLARAARVERVYFEHVWGQGCACVPLQARPTAADARQALQWMFRYAAETLKRGEGPELAVGDNGSDAAALLVWISEQQGGLDADKVQRILAHCGAVHSYEHHLWINAAGWCRAALGPSGLPLGNVLRRSFDEVIHQPLSGYVEQRNALLSGSCLKCRWGSVCRGAPVLDALGPGEEANKLWDPTCLMDKFEIRAPTTGGRV